ncbi:hypothetical protein F5879DRAFT_926711, partial [Lentinula edodes]
MARRRKNREQGRQIPNIPSLGINKWLLRVEEHISDEEDRYLVGTPFYKPRKLRQGAAATETKTTNQSLPSCRNICLSSEVAHPSTELTLLREMHLMHGVQSQMLSSIQALSHVVLSRLGNHIVQPAANPVVSPGFDLNYYPSPYPYSHHYSHPPPPPPPAMLLPPYHYVSPPASFSHSRIFPRAATFSTPIPTYVSPQLSPASNYPSHHGGGDLHPQLEPESIHFSRRQGRDSSCPEIPYLDPAIPPTSDTMSELRLGNGHLLIFTDADRSCPSGEKWLGMTTIEYLEKLRAVWNDTDPHWKPDSCRCRIKGQPIAMKYWGPWVIHPWKHSAVQQWWMHKASPGRTLMDELEKYPSINSFLSKYELDEATATISLLAKKLSARLPKGRRRSQNPLKSIVRPKKEMETFCADTKCMRATAADMAKIRYFKYRWGLEGKLSPSPFTFSLVLQLGFNVSMASMAVDQTACSIEQAHTEGSNASTGIEETESGFVVVERPFPDVKVLSDMEACGAQEHFQVADLNSANEFYDIMEDDANALKRLSLGSQKVFSRFVDSVVAIAEDTQFVRHRLWKSFKVWIVQARNWPSDKDVFATLITNQDLSRFIQDWIVESCDLERVRYPLRTASPYRLAAQMQAAISYRFRWNPLEWKYDEETQTWSGNPTKSADLTRYMQCLNLHFAPSGGSIALSGGTLETMKAFLNASRAEIITLGGSEQLGGDLKQEATFVQTLIVFRCLIPIQLVLSLSIENLECGNLGTHLCVRVAHKSFSFEAETEQDMIPYCIVRAISRWLIRSGIRSGSLFPIIRGNTFSPHSNAPM